MTTVEIFKTGNKKAAESIVALIKRMGNWYDVAVETIEPDYTQLPSTTTPDYVVIMKFHSPGEIWDEKYTKGYWVGVAHAAEHIYLHRKKGKQ